MMNLQISVRAIMVSAAFFATATQAPAELVSHHQLTVEPDASSRICISCHDGSLSKAVSFCMVGCGFSTSHAILKRYPPVGKADHFAPKASLIRTGIKLKKGKVTCISCHDLKNSSPPHLVMDNSGSRLCKTCHISK